MDLGVWESQKRVETAAKTWLSGLDSPVMLVLAVKVYEDYPKIIVQVQQAFRSVQFTHAGKAMEAICTRPNDTTFVDEHLRMPFEKIFWRMKTRDRPQEMDVIFTREDLTMVAESIWKAQGLI